MKAGVRGFVQQEIEGGEQDVQSFLAAEIGEVEEGEGGGERAVFFRGGGTEGGVLDQVAEDAVVPPQTLNAHGLGEGNGDGKHEGRPPRRPPRQEKLQRPPPERPAFQVATGVGADDEGNP